MRRVLWFPALFLLLGVVFGAGYSTGQEHPGSSEAKLDLSTFDRVRGLIESRYPTDVKKEDLETGAVKGLVEGTGDPYSAYLTSDEAKQLEEVLAGTVEGIGIEIGERNGQVTVIAPLPDSPASRAGILAGDVILAVEGEPTAGQQLDAVVKRIRGPKGTQVKLDVRTNGQPPRNLTLTRDTVRSATVKVEYRDNVAVLTVSRFGDETKNELDKAVADIKARQPRGVVLDLRSNPGGYLEGAIDLVSVFLKEGVVVKEQFAEGKSETRQVRGNPALGDVPLVVLMNKGSASASEITAGALRDNDRAKLVGEQTFGKGSVQDLIEIKDGAVLKLTIAEWLTPNGTSISKQGLKPDVEAASADPAAQLDTAIRQLPS